MSSILHRGTAVLLGIALVTTMLAPFTQTSHAASGDEALLINQSHKYAVLPPGRSATIWFEFKNTGTTAWTNTDPHPVSLNTDGPMRRSSMFQYRYWRATWRPARISQKTVNPGETARVRFSIKAPNKPGTWIERFALVRDTETRIPGGEVEFVVVVGSSTQLSSVYRAQPTQKTISLWVRPNEHILKSVTYKNTGYITLRPAGFGLTSVTSAPNMATSTATSPIVLQSTPAITTKARRAQNTSAIFDLVAPGTPGTYSRTLGLTGSNGYVFGSDVTVLLTVSNDPLPPIGSEPTVRVGVFSPVITKPVTITANGAYEVRSADDALLFTKNAGDVSSLTFNATTKIYSITAGTTKTTSQAVRFVPKDANTIMEITSMSGGYNRFRGILEAHYSTATSKLWMIDELPIESYLMGLGETGSTSPSEFVKTLITAARSYALYKIVVGKRHDNEYYKINSTTDQVYKGYNYEVKTPNITAGVLATRGLIVSHSSMISTNNVAGAIVAAYSSCTDGRTRSYYERWGGDPNDFPYLVSVPDPLGVCTDGGYPASYMTGGSGNHMVGMSAFGALRTSKQPGATFDGILRYYYSGSSIIRAYP